MNTQQEYLHILFNENVFAAGDTALAEVLGYGKNSRSTIGRIKKGEGVSDDKAAEIWDTLREVFFLSDEEIALTAESVAYGRNLFGELRELCGVEQGRCDKGFEQLLLEDYAALSPHFENELAPHLAEMKLQSLDLYLGMLSHCFILYRGITPYSSRGLSELGRQLKELDDLLYALFPANSRAHQAAEKIISYDLHDDHLTLLKLLYGIRAIIGNYIEENYFENYLREKGHLLDVGDDSFWVQPGEPFGSGSELWYFSVVPTKSPMRGSYIAMRLRAASAATDSFELVESYNLMFLIANDKAATQVLQIYDVPTGQISYAGFTYDYDTRRLEICFDETIVNCFALPTELQCVDCDKPQGRDEAVWANIIEKNIKKRCGSLLLSAVNSSSEHDFEYLDEYEVTNVSIDRFNVTVTVLCDGVSRSYALPLDAYAFLARLTPAEFVCVTRSKSRDELCISWNNLGQYIPLSEFRCVE